ncbi:MAG: DUF1365 domain-containing protein [Pseudomonadota bacterium]
MSGRSLGHVYEGAVMHRRLKPVGHHLKYSVFSFLFDVDRIDEMAKSMQWFSRNRINLFSFHDRDFGDGGDATISERVRQTLAGAGYSNIGQILLLAYPRMLGYVFNPLAVYYCYDALGDLRVMIYEVRNTFGGKHSYLIPVDGGKVDHEAAKRFHVSPFNEMRLRYRFVLSEPADRTRVFIETADEEGPVLNALFAGERFPLDDRKLLSLFFRYPLMTVKVIAGIHFEALKLLAKGMRLRSGDPDPVNAVTVIGPPATRRAA